MLRRVICHLVLGMGDRWEAAVRKDMQKGGEGGTQQTRLDLRRAAEGRWQAVQVGGNQGWLPACVVMVWHCQWQYCQGWQMTGLEYGEYGRRKCLQPLQLTWEEWVWFWSLRAVPQNLGPSGHSPVPHASCQRHRGIALAARTCWRIQESPCSWPGGQMAPDPLQWLCTTWCPLFREVL